MILKNAHTIRYEIQIYREGACCDQHPTRGWYQAKVARGILADPNTSQEYAEIMLERARADAPRANYRLVEIEETHVIKQTTLIA